MSTGVRWYYDRKRLDGALDRWHALPPPETDKDAVDNALMDLLGDPLNWGKEDGETGVWNGLASKNILIIYYPNRETGSIGVADINYL